MINVEVHPGDAIVVHRVATAYALRAALPVLVHRRGRGLGVPLRRSRPGRHGPHERTSPLQLPLHARADRTRFHPCVRSALRWPPPMAGCTG